MAEYNIHIIKLQLFQGIIEAFIDMLARKPNSIQAISVNLPEDLSRNY